VGYVGSVKITRTSYTIHGIHNFARQPKANDYGASYNLIQR
jgi:hypothetical protein